MPQIYRWESGKRQSEVPAVVSIAMSGPAIAGYFSADECQKPNDTTSVLKRSLSNSPVSSENLIIAKIAKFFRHI